MGTKIFIDALDAKNYLEQCHIKHAYKSCPVFKSLCLENDCHSYYKGMICYRKLTDNFTVFPMRCDSPLVTGSIAVEGL